MCDPFQGDGVVACFGYPNTYEDDAKRAVLAGLGLVERMAAAGPELRRRYGIDAPVRVGVHTGTVVLTSQTSGPAEGSDIVGVATNLAARLQAQADPDTVVISDATKDLVEADFDVVEIGSRALKGISRQVTVFRVLRARDAGRLLDGERLQSGSVVDATHPAVGSSGYGRTCSTPPVKAVPLKELSSCYGERPGSASRGWPPSCAITFGPPEGPSCRRPARRTTPTWRCGP